MNILHLNSSLKSQGSESSQLAERIVARLRATHPAAQVVQRDLAAAPLLPQDEEALQALTTPPSERSAQQAARVAQDDALIAEIQAADYVVLGVPMYNFGVPVQLKNWIDAIARARVTFRYTENGVEGLLQNKTVFVALSRGGKHRDQPSDSVVPFLRTVLGFLGMRDVHFVYAEGLSMGEAAAEQGRATAEREIEALPV